MRRKLTEAEQCWRAQRALGGSKQFEQAQGGAGHLIHYGRRYCETCNTYKPKGTRKAVKGWKCDDCKEAA